MKSLHRRVAIVVVIGAIAALNTFVPPAQAQSADPFGGSSQFCVKHNPPSGRRNSSDPGISPNSINIVAANVDVEGLARRGIILAPAEKIWKAVTDEINQNCGGINGRKIVLKNALGNPLASNPTATITANCIKATENYKAFMVVNIQSSQPMTRCVTYQHKAIGLIDGPGIHNTDDVIAAQGRLLSQYSPGDQAAGAFLRYGFKNHLFDNKKVLVLGANREASSAADLNAQFLQPLLKQKVDAYMEVLPCVPNNCNMQVGAVIERAKSRGVNMIVTGTAWITGTLGAIFKNMHEKGLRARVVGPYAGNIHSETVLRGDLAAAGTAAASFVSDNGFLAYAMEDSNIGGAYRAGAKPTAFANMCLDLVNRRMKNSPAWTYGQERFMTNSMWTTAVNVCRQMRAIARAIHSLGANVTTARAIAALNRQDNRDKAETTPALRDRIWYSRGDTTPKKVVPLRYHFPCSFAAAPSSTACMIPVDRPIRAFNAT